MGLLTVVAYQARIKKIMQKDDDVGKVAQATPIVICLCPFARGGQSLT